MSTLHVEGYCENPKCDARQFEITIKESYGPPHADEITDHLRCPVCGEAAKCHWVKTARERNREKLDHAVGRVNAELYRRDHPGELAVPFSVCSLDSLPAAWRAIGDGD